MERWTRFVLRFRWPILACWLVVLLAGGFAFTRLSSLLSNQFTVPGTDSERARTILERHFGDRSDGAFTVVFRLRDPVDRAAYFRLQEAADRAARRVPHATPRRLVPAGDRILYGDIVSTLTLAKAKGYTDDLYPALPHTPAVASYVTGQAAIQHDLDPIFSADLRKGEMIALPIAVLVLLAVFGISVAVTMPFLFAACTVMASLGGVYVYAHFLTTATYVTNLVFLIGLGIAIDYSLLVIYRYREELRRGAAVDEAIVRTMQTAGRAVVFSGATVAIGLALLLFMPLPFIRSIGVGGFLIPLAVRGFNLLKSTIGPGAISPSQVVADSGRPGGVRAPEVQAAVARLAASVRADRETASLRFGARQPYLDASGRYEQLIVAGRHEYGDEEAQ